MATLVFAANTAMADEFIERALAFASELLEVSGLKIS